MFLSKCQVDSEKGVLGNRRPQRLTLEQMFAPCVVQLCVINRLTFRSGFLMGGDFKVEHLG